MANSWQHEIMQKSPQMEPFKNSYRTGETINNIKRLNSLESLTQNVLCKNQDRIYERQYTSITLYIYSWC